MTAAVTIYPNVSPATRNVAVYTPVGAILHLAGVDITVKRPKGHKGKVVTRFLLPPDAFAIIEAASSRSTRKWAACSRFLLYTGCRIGEALALKWETISLERSEAYIEISKNDDPRTVRLTKDALASLGPRKDRLGKRVPVSPRRPPEFPFPQRQGHGLRLAAGCKTEARTEADRPALPAVVGDVPHVLPYVGDVDAALRRRGLAGAGCYRTLARSAIRGALRSCRFA